MRDNQLACRLRLGPGALGPAGFEFPSRLATLVPMPTLFVLSGPDIGCTHDLGDGAVLGRTSDCDAILHEGSVSRRHARLEKHGEQWILVDLDSRNGISLEGRRQERLELSDGLEFRIGKLELRFRVDVLGESLIDRPRETSPAPAAPAAPAEEQLPAIEFHGAGVGGDEPEDFSGFGDEIEIEGEELIDAPPAPQASSAPPPASATTPARPSTPPTSRPAASRPSSPAPAPRTASSSSSPVEVRDTGRKVLQYSKVPQRSGIGGADLAQFPLWVRLLVAALALVFFAGVFYVAFYGTAALKGDAAVEEVDDSGE